ncbi:MAG: sterol desaturase/sphingolipid hydroxylase (fatty acid hydroxylase superfamily), partial [Candidatus Omnitrophota bacterium]
MDINSLRLILFFGTLAAMFCIETWKPRRVWQTPRLRRFSFHMTTSIVNTVITRAVCMAPFLALLWWSNENAWGLAHWLKLDGIVEIIATIIVLDLFDYWWHRFNHHVPFLWRFHRYHHMDTHVDVTTALRFHPGELVLSFIAKAIWVLIWGPSIFAFALFETLITVY